MGQRTNAEGLTLRQEKYVNGVVGGSLSKEACAKRAGYRNPAKAVEMLGHLEKVQSATDRRMRVAARKADASREEIERFHLALVRGQIPDGHKRRPSLKHAQDSAKELVDMNGWTIKGEAADPMVVRVEMGCVEEMREIVRGSASEAEKGSALLKLARAKGL